MRKSLRSKCLLLFTLCAWQLLSCNNTGKRPAKEAIKAINLRRGDIVLCGPADKQFGLVEFEISCSEKVKQDFNLGLSLLHSFEYDEAEKVFAKIIDTAPGCAMAYWGVAMCNYHPLWTTPTLSELEKGSKAIAIAGLLTQKTKRESDYIEAIGAFYNNWDKTDHHTRSVAFEKGMGKTVQEFPDDKEATILYALSLDAAADPADTSFVNQKKAGELLTGLYTANPNHLGIVHYIIHSYDYPPLAVMALPAARHYASIAPSSSHAQHMPSHIFTRLGLWDECIQSNLAAMSSATCYASAADIDGHWDEELHAMDYLVYAYLQKAENALAAEQVVYLTSINKVYPVNFKDAYAFAAIPSRYLIENKRWEEAAVLQIHPAHFPWQKFPWQNAIIHFTRLLGSVHTGDIPEAKIELKNLNILYDTLFVQRDPYKANQVAIQVKTGSAWILLKENKQRAALELMKEAADMEDKTEKHPVSPGEVIPAREFLADMLYACNQPKRALEAYQTDLKTHPNRFNGLYGAARCAQKINDRAGAVKYYRQLVTVANAKDSKRPELDAAVTFLKKQ